MTDDMRRRKAYLRTAVLAGTGMGMLGAIGAHADDQGSANKNSQDEVYIFGQRDDSYKVEDSGLGKLAAPLMDVPQSIATISEQVLKDRAVTNLNDALKSVPGITIGAGEFRSLGNSPTIRGFPARTDMFLDGIRDYGDYYRDPFNLESIEVLEGPASILFGRGSTGGVIEQDSKTPRLNPAVSGTVTGGTDETRRLTMDINEPIPGIEGAAARLNLMGHQQDVTDRDVVEDKRFGIAPSLALGLGTPTRMILSYLHQYNDDVPDYGLPYFGTTVPDVSRSNFYGFKSDYMRTTTDVTSFKVDHDFSDAFTIENQVRYASYARQFRFTEPLIATTLPLTTPLASVQVTRNDNTGASTDTMLWDQLFGTLRWTVADVQNTSIIGFEGGHEKTDPVFLNSTGVATTSLLAPNEDQVWAPKSTFPRYRTYLKADSYAPFLINTAKWDNWEAILGIRWDHFHVNYHDVNYSATTPGLVVKTDYIPHTDELPSYRAALSYKPAANGSVYLSFGTSFNPSAEDLSLISSSRSFSLNNAQLDPEKNKTYELGTKWTLLDSRLDVTGSIFRLEKDNARVPNPANVLLNILAGSQRVDGAEVLANGHITAAWQITTGYTYLDDMVTKTAPGAAPDGSPLMNTPKHAFTAWTAYDLTDRIQFGGGGRFVSSQYTQNVPPIKTVPGFWTFDLMAKYAFSEHFAAQVNLNNVFNRYYFDQLHFFHVVPGEGRTALFSLSASF